MRLGAVTIFSPQKADTTSKTLDLRLKSLKNNRIEGWLKLLLYVYGVNHKDEWSLFSTKQIVGTGV